MSDAYVLLKDLPFMEAGQKYIPWRMGPFDSSFNSYIPDKVGCRYERFAIHRDYVEDNPEWFKKEEPIDWREKYYKILHEISLVHTSGDKKYTEEAMRKCFEASRSFGFPARLFGPTTDLPPAYKTFDDYINSIT